MNKEMKEKTVDDEILYQGRIFAVHRLNVILPDGREGTREIVNHHGGAAIVALTRDRQVVLVRQYRIAAGEALLEIPAGKLEKGEAPFVCAQRELEEESGFQAANWRFLGCSYPSPGYTSEMLHLYLATGLTKAEAHPDDGEFLEAELMPFDHLLRKIRSGEIRDGKTITAALLTVEVLKEEESTENGRK